MPAEPATFREVAIAAMNAHRVTVHDISTPQVHQVWSWCSGCHKWLTRMPRYGDGAVPVLIEDPRGIRPDRERQRPAHGHGHVLHMIGSAWQRHIFSGSHLTVAPASADDCDISRGDVQCQFAYTDPLEPSHTYYCRFRTGHDGPHRDFSGDSKHDWYAVAALTADHQIERLP